MNFRDEFGLCASEKVLKNSQSTLTIISEVEDLAKEGKTKIQQGLSDIKSGNKAYWADPFGESGKDGLAKIASGSVTKDLGTTLSLVGNVGKIAGTAGDVIQGGQFIYQIATKDFKGASTTVGDFLGGTAGGAVGGIVAGAIISSTGVGTIPGVIIMVICAGGGSIGGGTVGGIGGGAVYDQVTK